MKLNNILLIFILALNLIVPVSSYGRVPVNLTAQKYAVVDYYESGNFEKDVGLALQNAYQYLQKRVDENSRSTNPSKLAIVFDIDDTCLSNFNDYRKKDFAHTHEIIVDSFHAANAPAIKQILDFYNLAIKNGVNIFFISGRSEDVRYDTIINLQKAGFYHWTGLYLAKRDETKFPAQVFKTALRAKLTHEGYSIILNIGDQDSDFAGGYAEKIVKIPNPLYSITLESARSDSRQ